MSDPADIALMEHLALHSPLSLQDFCTKFSSVHGLPAFRFDSENETEWGFTALNNIEYNISRPYETDTLRNWDPTVPSGCNFGISLILLSNHARPTHEWAHEHVVIPVARTIAVTFSTTVYYHRTWLGIGQNVMRDTCFPPDDAS
jgi:hypothetical protein